MADNTRQGDNAVIAADDIGGVLVQRVKPAFGPDGAAVDVSAADPLPVTLGAGPVPVAVDGTVPVSVAATLPVSVADAVTVTTATDLPVTLAGETVAVSAAADLPVTLAGETVAITAASDVPVALAAGSLDGLTLEDTQQMVLLLLAEIRDRLPRIDTLDRAAVSIEAGSVGISGTVATLTTLTAAQSVGQGTTLRPLDAAPVHWANAGAEHIYRQIVVS